MLALSPEMAYSQFMKAPAEHISTKRAPADQGAADMNAPVYDGKWGYTTEAEKQALIASLDQADRDLEDGKAIRADNAFWETELNDLANEAKKRGLTQ